MDYERLKKLAKEKRCPVTELIALASQNDPFYVGTKSAVRHAEWFAGLWEQFNYTSGVHLRRIHYRMISQDTPVLMPNGKPYLNTTNCWQILDNASKYARYLKLVDPWAFDDRRNGKPLLFMEGSGGDPWIDIGGTIEDWFFLELDPFPDIPYYQVENYEADQRYHLEIWCEKSTMNDILVPICRSHGVNLVTAVGEFSITHIVWLMDRLRAHQKPCRILYISDFDPAGLSMPVAAARKIEKFLDDEESDFDVKLYPVILTHEQCLEYQLPRTPIKETERRAGRFEKRFGEGATELDALEALHPGELKKILNKAIEQYRDSSLCMKAMEAKSVLHRDLESIRENVLAEYEEDIEELQGEYERIAEEFGGRVQDLGERIQNLWQAIKEDMERNLPDIDEYPIPEAKEADELPGALFNANRDYLEQIVAYKNFQGKPTRALHKEPPIKTSNDRHILGTPP